MASYHPVEFSSHWHCGSGDMLLVAKQKESRCSRLNPLVFLERTWIEGTRHIILIIPILVTHV